MDYEYPSFGLESQYQGTSAQGYLFLVFARTGGAANAVMIQMAPPPGAGTWNPPPPAYAAAALKIVTDMRRVLRDGVEKHARDIMREERRFTMRDQEEKLEAAENAFKVAELIGDQELAEAEADLEKQVKAPVPPKKKRKTWMGDDVPETAGARELVQAGFKVLREIPVPGKGPGLWYEVLEPKSQAPKDWSPSGKPKDQLLMLRQPSGVWHAFYQFRGTGSGDTPTRALTGGLGDVFEHDVQIRAYCEAIMAAPRGLSREYEGLAAAQGACFNESQQS